MIKNSSNSHAMLISKNTHTGTKKEEEEVGGGGSRGKKG